MTVRSSGSLDVLALEYAEALLDASAHPSRSNRVLGRALGDGTAASSLYVDVIPGALHEVGRRWQRGEISVAAEHLATSTVQVALRQLARQLPQKQRNRQRAIVAAVDGELHDLGARIVADLLVADGWEVFYIGASTPTGALVSLVAERHPDAVLLSATMPEHLRNLVDAVARVRAVEPAPTYVVVGGQACTRLSNARQVGADAMFLRADNAVDWLRPLLRSIQQAPLVESLTDREEDVLTLLSGGLTNQEIADHLSISLATAKTHVAHILRKLELRNRSEAAALATKRAIADRPAAARVL